MSNSDIFSPTGSEGDRTPMADSQSTETLVALGDRLRRSREAMNLSTDEAARAIKIPPRHIISIESGDLQALPEPIYVRGFLKHYGNLVGLNGEALAQQFANSALPHVTPMAPKASAKSLASSSGAQGLKPFHAWIAYVVLIVAAVAAISWFWEQNGPKLAQNSGQSEANLARNRESEPPTPVANAPATRSPESADPASATAADTPAQSSDSSPIASVFPERDAAPESTPESDRLTVGMEIVNSASWVQVIADNTPVFEGILQPGQTREWEADDTLFVRAGNAGGVRLALNGEDIGIMGDAGSVRERTFNRPTPPAPSETATAIASTSAVENALKLTVNIIESASWLRIVADSRTVFEGTLQPGAKQEWEADNSIELVTGNAGGVSLALNNRELGVMGELGTVQSRTFDRGNSAN